MELNRQMLSGLIVDALSAHKETLKRQYAETQSDIGYFFLDDLLPGEITRQIFDVFPKPSEMKLKNTIRERKYIAVQMDQYHPLLEEIVYAFQAPEIVKIVSEICQIEHLIPDENLYAGGISMMGNGHYLHPHLDNSHDKDRNFWRVLNLLFYVTPDWQLENGGNLELWPDGLEGKPVTITSKFNRLAVMATHNNSLHSVSPIDFEGDRCCVSNYYFSQNPLLDDDSFHVTSFRARPGNTVTDALLQVDAALRMNLRKLFKKGIKENPHVYKKKNK